MNHGTLLNHAASLGARAVLLRQRAATIPAGPEHDAATETARIAQQEADDAWTAARAATERYLAGGEPTPPPSWDTPRAFVERLYSEGRQSHWSPSVDAVAARDAALLAALQACVVPGNDAATVENIRGVMAALKGEGR